MAIKKGDEEVALQQAEAVAKFNPAAFEAWFAIARLSAANDPRRSAECFRICAEMKPADVYYRFQEGLALRKADRPAEAILAFKTVAEGAHDGSDPIAIAAHAEIAALKPAVFNRAIEAARVRQLEDARTCYRVATGFLTPGGGGFPAAAHAAFWAYMSAAQIGIGAAIHRPRSAHDLEADEDWIRPHQAAPPYPDGAFRRAARGREHARVSENGVDRTARPSNRIQRALLKHLRADPAAVFCRQVGPQGEVAISWRELEGSCGGFQDAYRRAGLPAGGQVLIFLRHTPHLYGAFFGAMLGGMTPAFMPCSSPRQDPDLYWRSHDELLRLIKPAAIVADAATADEMRGGRIADRGDRAGVGRSDNARAT